MPAIRPLYSTPSWADAGDAVATMSPSVKAKVSMGRRKDPPDGRADRLRPHSVQGLITSPPIRKAAESSRRTTCA